MRELPDFKTVLVPMGTYTAEVKGEITEKESTFDKTRSYLELPLILGPHNGEYFPFTWCFTERNPKLADFLIALGGKRLSSGNVQHPSGPYIGRKVMMSIGQRTAKGKDVRIVNEVLAIWAYDSTASEPHVDDDGNTIPF